MATQPPDDDQNNQAKQPEAQQPSIHASVDRSLLSFAIGQIKVNISRARRQSPRDKLRELMPQACQPQLDWLLSHAHIPPRELFWACKQKALVAPDGTLRQSRLAPVDYMWSMVFAVASGLMALACLLLMQSQPWPKGLYLAGGVALLSLMLYASLAIGVWPHLTARKAVQALASKQLP